MAKEHTVPIIEVAYTHDRWWSLPHETSNGQQTHPSRYKMDFTNNIQTIIDNGRMRSIRIICVRLQDVVAQFTGEMPAPEPAADVDEEGA